MHWIGFDHFVASKTKKCNYKISSFLGGLIGPYTNFKHCLIKTPTKKGFNKLVKRVFLYSKEGFKIRQLNKYLSLIQHYYLNTGYFTSSMSHVSS